MHDASASMSRREGFFLLLGVAGPRTAVARADPTRLAEVFLGHGTCALLPWIGCSGVSVTEWRLDCVPAETLIART